MSVDLAHGNPRRSLLLLAVGAAGGLVLAGYGLFTAQGTRSHAVPPEAIALVNQRPILRSDFITQVQTQYSVRYSDATPAQRERVLEDMIDEELMVQRGLDIGLPSYDPDVRQALVAGVELELFADVLAQRPTEGQLRAYYDEHRAKYVRDGIMRLRDLMLGASPERARPEHPAAARPSAAAPSLSSGAPAEAARAAVQALRQGEPVDSVAARFGLRDSGRLLDSGHIDMGDVFDFAARARLAPAVFGAASRLAGGEVSNPVPAPDGIHVIVMLKRVFPAQRPFAEVSNEVWRDLSEDAKHRVREANLRYLRSRADILVAPP